MLLCRIIGHKFKAKYQTGGTYNTEFCVRCGKRNQ